MNSFITTILSLDLRLAFQIFSKWLGFFCKCFQDAVQVLLKHSADVNARDKNWQTPLHIAAANKAVKCAEALVPLLSNVNVSD